MNEILLPFAFPFMQKAFLVVLLIAPAAALLSCLLVLRRWSLMSDASTHAVLPGVVLAHMMGAPLMLGAFISALFCITSTGVLQATSRIKQDTALGVLFSGLFGLGIVLYSKIQTELHLDHILFGNILGLSNADIWTAGGIAWAVFIPLALGARSFFAHAFDPMHAQVSGLRVGLMHMGLLVGLAAVTVALLSAVGIILAIAILIAPGATGYLLARRVRDMVLWAFASVLGAGLLGVYASFFLSSAPAPTIVLVQIAMFLAALAWSLRRG